MKHHVTLIIDGRTLLDEEVAAAKVVHHTPDTWGDRDVNNFRCEIGPAGAEWWEL